MSYQLGNAKVWDGAQWVDALGGEIPYAEITSTSGEAFAGADGSATAYIWKANGTVVVGTGGLIDYLVVGGGGGGASGLAGRGGGGAGEVASNVLQTNKTFFLPAGTYAVTVGAGGASVSGNAHGLPGTDSSIGSVLVAKRGGGGGYSITSATDLYSPVMGGSGGGMGTGITQGPIQAQAGVQQTSGSLTRFGNRGGFNLSDTTRTGGGGGGAGAVGADGGAGTGAGGAGKAINIISTSLATTQAVGEVSGSDVYWGGGGSGGQNTDVERAGGIGGGGVGGHGTGPEIGADGDANTGGGGGGQSQTNSAIAGAGGSGVVIIRVGG